MRGGLEWPVHGQPEIELAGRIPFSSANILREYRHPAFALHQHQYRGRLVIGRRSFDLRAGDVTLTPPEVVSRYELAAAGYHWCIHFQPPAIPAGAGTFRLPLHLPLSGRGGFVTERMRQIAELSRSREENKLARAAAGSLLQELLLRLALDQTSPRAARRKETRAGLVLDAAKERLENQFHLPLTITDLAGGSGLSRNYFSARFRARFGRTAQSYLLHRRLEAARTLWVSSSLSIKEIAFECGIPDPNHFNKQFRRVAGLSPTAFRARPVEKW